MAGSRLCVPLLTPEDVKPHLGSKDHWRDGRSAKLLVESWFNADGIPAPIDQLLKSAPELCPAELIDAWVERKTNLRDGCGAPSQTDLLALLGHGAGIAVLGVEAKVDESFGPYVRDWIAAGSTPGSGRRERRLRLLCERLKLDPASAMHLRYQLLHRTAATLIEAERFRAPRAVFAVHSFCPDATGHGDFSSFVAAIGFGAVGMDALAGPRRFGATELWVGWKSTRP